MLDVSMNWNRMKHLAAVLALLTAALSVGCQSSSTPPSTDSAMPAKAVLLTTGNGTTEVLLPAGDGGVKLMGPAGATHCAQCDADAAKYFKTGELTPTCSVCGAKHQAISGIN